MAFWLNSTNLPAQSAAEAAAPCKKLPLEGGAGADSSLLLLLLLLLLLPLRLLILPLLSLLLMDLLLLDLA